MNIDLEILKNLPTKESRKAYITRKYGDMWNLRKFDNPWYRSNRTDQYWFILDKVLKKFLGKSVDKAYSKYCKLVRFDEKEYFWKKFTDLRWGGPNYLIDANKNIQLNPKIYSRPKKRIVFRSFDYEVSYYDIVTKKIIKNYASRYNENVIVIVTKGFEKTFESKKDPEYIRLMAEKKKLIRLNNKYLKKLAKEKKYSFMSEKEKAKRANELDIQKRNSHGFDEESFKGIEYHGQKRKRL